MSMASTPPALAALPGTANQDTGKILRKPNDFQTRKVQAEKEDEERLLHYLEEARGGSTCSEGPVRGEI